MIYKLIERLKYILDNDSTLTEVKGRIYQVDDLEAYNDFIQAYPAIGISRNEGETVIYDYNTRQLDHILAPLNIRVYTRSMKSPEAARKVLDVLTWKVAKALQRNPYMRQTGFNPETLLIDSEVKRIDYGSQRVDKNFDEYATISYFTSRAEMHPEDDTEYYDVVTTMIRVSATGGGYYYEEK